MAKTKTAETKEDVKAFIDEFVDSEQMKRDSYELIKLMQSVSGHKPKMWGPSIIGFGSYHYKYESGHEGDMCLIGFSPRKAAISLYVYSGLDEQKQIITNLGKFKMGKACIYVKKLSDINMQELTKLMKASINYIAKKYPSK